MTIEWKVREYEYRVMELPSRPGLMLLQSRCCQPKEKEWTDVPQERVVFELFRGIEALYKEIQSS